MAEITYKDWSFIISSVAVHVEHVPDVGDKITVAITCDA